METFTDDTIVALASFLSPHDVLSLSLTCKRFGAKHGVVRSRESRGGIRKVRQKTDAISITEIAAHTVLHAKWTDEEKNALPRHGDESWIGLYQELLKLFHLPLQFDKLVGQCVEYAEGSERAKVLVRGNGLVTCTAICSNIMRAGKHYVSFQVDDNPSRAAPGIMCGVMRPTTKDITSLENCHPADDLSSFSLKDYEMLHSENVDVCLLNTHHGNGIIRSGWNRWETPDEECQSFDWDGMEPTHEKSYKIGLALDLDKGTLDVYKKNKRLGTMKTGLFGEYCWVASMLSFDALKVSVTIGR